MSPSNPLKLYRTQTVSGYSRTCFRDGACEPGISTTDVFGGTYKYDRTTCGEANTQAVDHYLGVEDTCDQGAFDYSFPLGKNPLIGPATSPTHREGVGSSSCGLLVEVTTAADLTDEDTEDDAEARAADLVAEWSGCVNCNACSAFRTDRTGTSDTSFGWRKVQVKCSFTAISPKAAADSKAATSASYAATQATRAATFAAIAAADPGNTAKAARAEAAQDDADAAAAVAATDAAAAAIAGPGYSYNVKIHFSRRLLGSGGPFLDLGSPYETTISGSNPEAEPAATDWIDVPSEAGWETIASSCEVTAMP